MTKLDAVKNDTKFLWGWAFARADDNELDEIMGKFRRIWDYLGAEE
jgi:hypothetical protein